MSDPIAPVNNTGAVKIVAAASEPVKITALPSEIQSSVALQGQVIAKGNGQTTIQTAQGNIVLSGDLALQVGQKVQIALQKAENQMTQLLLSVISTPPDKSVQPAAQTFVTVQGNTSTTAQLATPEQYPDSVAPQITALPQKLSPQALQVLVQDALQLPDSKALPPSLQQGLQNLQQLSHVLLPNNSSVLPSTGEVKLVEQILQQLPALLRAPVPSMPTALQIINAPLQILQLLPPGQIVTQEFLDTILQVLQPQQPITANTTAPPTQQSQTPQTPPILALVLGPANAGPAVQQPTLLLLQNNGQQALGLLPLPDTIAGKPQLFVPGTVLVLQSPQNQTPIATQTAWPILANTAPQNMVLPSPLHPSLGDTWPALDAIWKGLQTDSDIPAAAQALHFMRAMLPQPNAQQFPATILLFFAAIKSSKTEHWLPPATIDALADPVQKNILQQLTTDLARMKTVLDDAPTDRWQALPLPLQVNEQIQRLQLHFKPVFFDDEKQNPQEQNKRKNRNMRFVLDVPQTRLGDVQIDGMMRPIQLDMVVRTEQSLPSIAETEMRLRFFRVLEINGLAGELNFQSGRSHYVRV